VDKYYVVIRLISTHVPTRLMNLVADMFPQSGHKWLSSPGGFETSFTMRSDANELKAMLDAVFESDVVCNEPLVNVEITSTLMAQKYAYYRSHN